MLSWTKFGHVRAGSIKPSLAFSGLSEWTFVELEPSLAFFELCQAWTEPSFIELERA